MRILMLDNEFPPLGGGMGTANLALFRQFAQLPGIEVDLITSALGGKSEYEKFSDNIAIHKVPVWNRNIHHSTNRELVFYAVQALFLAKRLIKEKRYDFCFAWSALPAGAVALALRQIHQLPYMLWVSGPDIPGFEQRYRYLYPVLTPLIRQIWRYAEPLIAKCQEEVDMIRVVDSKVEAEIIPNGADLSGLKPRNFGEHEGALRVICVARLIERKGQHHLIQAVKRLEDAGIDVVVDLLGAGDSLQEFKSLANELGAGEKINFHGYIAREKLQDYFDQADVFVLPSFNEGMSLAALEAMAAGLPLVVTRTGGTSLLVEEGVNGFAFDWADIDSLVDHLSRLSADRDLIRQMGKASRKRAAQFSWDSIAAKYLELFEASPGSLPPPVRMAA